MNILRRALVAAAIGFVGLVVFERLVPPHVRRAYQKYVGNPTFRFSAGLVPGWAVIETIGHKSGRARRVPVGGRRMGHAFWLVAGNPKHVHYVRNIKANPNVRVRTLGRWHKGTAQLCPEDNAGRRSLLVNPVNGVFIRLANRELVSIRIDLEGVH